MNTTTRKRLNRRKRRIKNRLGKPILRPRSVTGRAKPATDGRAKGIQRGRR